LGVPVVDVGSRQRGRERASNVLWAPHDAAQIAAAIQQQIAHGRYPSDSRYGTGDSGERIAEVLVNGSHSVGTRPEWVQISTR
jgi:UDP-N-acetylglucosamine 2-epimerase